MPTLSCNIILGHPDDHINFRYQYHGGNIPKSRQQRMTFVFNLHVCQTTGLRNGEKNFYEDKIY
jgi:hypothetical protein